MKFLPFLAVVFVASIALYMGYGPGGDVSAKGWVRLQSTQVENFEPMDGEVLRGLQSKSPVRANADQVASRLLEESLVAALANEPDETNLRIVVLDSIGEPLPCYPVEICTRSADKRFALIGPRPIFHALSDSKGVARISLSDFWLHTTAAEPVFAVFGFPWQTEFCTELTREHWSGEPVMLEVPRRGTAQIELLNAEGQRWLGKARVFADLGPNQRPAIQASDGTHWIHDLPLGQRLRFGVQRIGVYDLEDWMEPSLTRASPRRFLQIIPGISAPRLTGTLLGMGGIPLVQQACTVELAGQTREPIQTDSLGHFHIECPVDQEGDLTITCSQGGDWQDSRVTLKVPSLNRGETKDLGEVSLLPRPFLVAGTFDCGAGALVSGTVVVESQNAKGEWKYRYQRTVVNRHSFRVFGDHNQEKMRLRFHKDWFGAEDFELKEPVYFLAGTEGVLVRLERLVQVLGEIQGVQGRTLEVQFVYASGETRTLGVRDASSMGLGGTGSSTENEGCFLGSLPIGLANVHVIDTANGSTLKTIANVRLDPGMGNPQVLSKIDLE